MRTEEEYVGKRVMLVGVAGKNLRKGRWMNSMQENLRWNRLSGEAT